MPTDPLDAIKLARVRDYLNRFSGLRLDAAKVFQAAAGLSAADRAELARHATTLTGDLKAAALRSYWLAPDERPAAFAAHPPDPELIELACLYPGVKAADGKAGDDVPSPLAFLGARPGGFTTE